MESEFEKTLRDFELFQNNSSAQLTFWKTTQMILQTLLHISVVCISDPNYGAYYEDGYSLGLGKEVVICCSDEVFHKDFGTEAKYRKPHFEIAQKQLLICADCDDLTKKLTE